MAAVPAFHPDTRRTGLDGFDQRYGGLVPGEVLVLASDELDHARGLALAMAAQATRADAERRQRPGQVWWYRAGSYWTPQRFRAELQAHAGEGAARISCTGVERSGIVRARDLEKQARGWVDQVDVPGLIVVDTIEDVAGRWSSRAQALKGISLKRPHVPVVVLALHVRGAGPSPATFADVGDAADFLMWATPKVILGARTGMVVDVRKARSGYPEARFSVV